MPRRPRLNADEPVQRLPPVKGSGTSEVSPDYWMLSSTWARGVVRIGGQADDYHPAADTCRGVGCSGSKA